MMWRSMIKRRVPSLLPYPIQAQWKTKPMKCALTPMRWQSQKLPAFPYLLRSRMFIPVLKKDPSDAQLASHKLMMRGGLLHRV